MFKKITKKRAWAVFAALTILMSTTTHGIAFAASDLNTKQLTGEPKAEKASQQHAEVQPLVMNHNIASMTEKRTIQVKFTLPEGVDAKKIEWTYGGKPLSEWKTFEEQDYTGPSFIRVSHEKVSGRQFTADVTFDLVYGTSNLAEPQLQRPLFASLMGTYELTLKADGKAIAQAPVKLTPYASYLTYDELKPAIDEVTSQAAQKNDRYIQTTSIGKSVEGRDIYLTIVAKDKNTIDKYENVTHPAMLNDPKRLQADIKSGAFGDYAVPIWVNNIHPNESPGVDAIFNYFKSTSLDEKVTFRTTSTDGKPDKLSFNVDDALNNVFFIFVYTNNPDGRVHQTRGNANDFDLNRDNSYQTQPETRSVTEQIAKWSPLSFLDLHGYDRNFLIEPATPPHDPNMEYDLLIDNMLEQAKAMGEAGIANTKYDHYHIPYEENRKTAEDPTYVSKGTSSGWDDASPAYTAVFAMHQGALGHTLETPEFNEESTKALYYSTAAATAYVMDNKEKLFLNQLQIYERGIDNIDDHAVDPYLINAKHEEIGRPREGNSNFFPEYYVLPVDESVQKNALETYHMIEYFLRNGVKVERSTEAITVDGVTYPQGSFVVNMHQALRGMANLVLYDGIDVSDYEFVAGEIVQNFPNLRGFDRYVIREPHVFANKTIPVTSVSVPATSMPANTAYVLIRNSNNDAIRAVNELLTAGKGVTMLTSSGTGNQAGDFVVSTPDLSPFASKYFLNVKAFGDSKPNGKELQSLTVSALGESAFVLKDLGFKVSQDQDKADILVNTFESSALVEKGKPYIAYGNMGMTNVKDLIPDFTFAGPQWERYEGVFLADVNQDEMITAAYDKEEYFYTVSGSYIKTVPKKATILAKISKKDDFYKAGWWPGHASAKGQIMAFTYEANHKNITVFSNELTNVGHPQHQYRLLANSIFSAVHETPQSSGSDDKFSDLNSVEPWAGHEIRELVDAGVLQGTGKNRFDPLKPVTRAEFVAMIVRAFDIPESTGKVTFKDVSPSSWYHTYVTTAVESKVAEGVGGDRFEPGLSITREEMSQIVSNTLKLKQEIPTSNATEVLEQFTDKDLIAPYARDSVAFLTESQLIQGVSASTYGPKQLANRAQAAVMISRMKHFINHDL
ncbi:S-layer homology domain-containing protein [Paenibacillus sp. FSL K6-1318]|uniref:M14 family metallopeptidase n=1 Tax=Paenibacillus sp. FSL K6-1318 TaxID=2975291 RepID=UPI0030EC0988